MIKISVTRILKSLSLAVAFAAVLSLGQGVARADEVFIAGFTNGCFGAGCTPGASATAGGLVYSNSTFTGTTANGTARARRNAGPRINFNVSGQSRFCRRLIRTGAMDSLGRPRRELLWQLREVAGASRGRVDGRRRFGVSAGRPGSVRRRPGGRAGPGVSRRPRPRRSRRSPESERIGDAYAVVGLDARRQVVTLFRPALERLGAVTRHAALARPLRRSGRDRRAGRHSTAPDDGEGDGLPRPRGRDRDGQRHALAGYLGSPPRRRPASRPAPGRR